MEHKGNKIEKFICNYCLTVLSQSEKCTKCGSTLISISRSQKASSDRELALEWWDNLFGTGNQLVFVEKYYSHYLYDTDLFSTVSEQEIENIWRNETDREIIQSVIKSNQKQYKKFEPELFRAYIEKFSDEDKREACRILNSIVAKI